MFCKHCGNLIGEEAYTCPYCNAPIRDEFTQQPMQPYGQQQPAQQYRQQIPQQYDQPGNTDNAVAIVGFVLAFLIPLAGLICSIIGYNNAKQQGLRNKDLAFAGIIVSIVVLVLCVLSVLLYVGLVLSLAFY